MYSVKPFALLSVDSSTTARGSDIPLAHARYGQCFRLQIQHGAGSPGRTDGGRHGGGRAGSHSETIRDAVLRLHAGDMHAPGLRRLHGHALRDVTHGGEGVCAAAEQRQVGRGRGAAPVPLQGVQPTAAAVPGAEVRDAVEEDGGDAGQRLPHGAS